MTLPLSTVLHRSVSVFFFFFNDTATTEIYTLSLHDALPIYRPPAAPPDDPGANLAEFAAAQARLVRGSRQDHRARSEEHTSELQSPDHLVCRLLLEKKKKSITPHPSIMDWTTDDRAHTRVCR